MIWLGAAVSPQILDDLYGVENLDELDIRMVRSFSSSSSLPLGSRTTDITFRSFSL